MKKTIKALAQRVPFIKKMREQLGTQGVYPAGHYYSPIPTREDVLSYVQSRTPATSELLGINLNKKSQRDTLEEYISFYQDLPFPEKKNIWSQVLL